MENFCKTYPDELSDEVAKLVFTIQEAELRLQELTGGEVDAVLLPAGKSYLLSEARDRQRESEEKFQQLANTVSDVFWIRSPDMKVVHYVSPAFERVWGRSVAFLYENPTRWVDFIFQADRERVQNAITKFVDNVAGFDIEYRIIRPDGKISWLHTRGFRVLDSAGKVIRLTGMTTDITERQKARQQFQLLETCVEHLNDLVIITEAEPIDEPGPRIVFVNNAFVRRTGYTREEALGKSPRFLQGEKTERAALDRIRFAMQRHEPVQAEIINYTKNGEPFWLDLEIVPITNNQGQVTHFVAVERDITERKRAEETLRESEERFAGAFLQAPIGVALVAPDGQFLKVNRALCKFSGYTEIELLARTFQDITHPEDLAADLEFVRQMLDGEIQTYAMEKRYVHKHGHQITALLNVSLVRDQRSQPFYFIAQVQDITERKRLEEEFRQVQKMEGIGQLAGGVAHDFNNILAVIQLQSGLLKAEKNLSSRQLELAGDIEKAAQRAASLTRQLLLFSRKQPMQRRNLDLNQVVNSMAKMLQRILGEDIEISYKYYGGPLPIHADAGMMDQVLLNFAVNARDAMPKAAG